MLRTLKRSSRIFHFLDLICKLVIQNLIKFQIIKSKILMIFKKLLFKILMMAIVEDSEINKAKIIKTLRLHQKYCTFLK